MALVIAGHPTAVTVVEAEGHILDIEPGKGAIHGAKRLVQIQTGPLVEA